MKNGEYIDYRDKYFIVDYSFNEINVKWFLWLYIYNYKRNKKLFF